MKSYRELKIIDPENRKEKLISFLDSLKGIQKKNWIYNNELSIDYARNISKDINEVSCFEGVGPKYDIARIWLVIWGREIKVANIVPTKTNKLSYDQYNSLLEDFYQELVAPTARHEQLDVQISPPETDIREIIGAGVFIKLMNWANTCNRDSGNSNEPDFRRWASFLISSFTQESKLTPEIFRRILKEELDWKDNDVIEKLTEDYEYGIDILKFYAEHSS